jgi:hypothetical protein
MHGIYNIKIVLIGVAYKRVGNRDENMEAIPKEFF